MNDGTDGRSGTGTPVLASESVLAALPAMPEVPDDGLVDSVKYTLAVGQARRARSRAITVLQQEVEDHVGQLDGTLAELGGRARAHKLGGRHLAEENAAIDFAEQRRGALQSALGDLARRRDDEAARHVTLQSELEARRQTSEAAATTASATLSQVEADRKTAMDRRKGLDRELRQRLKTAEDREKQASRRLAGSEMTPALLESAAELRREAGPLQAARDEAERSRVALDEPLRIAQATDRQTRAELVTATRALEDAREGHRQRLGELEAERARSAGELRDAELEIRRRMATLGTLVNLHRTEGSAFTPLYARIDVLRAEVARREGTVERLRGELASFDHKVVARGVTVLVGAAALVLALVSLLIVFL